MYQNFIGIDIGKDHFAAALSTDKTVQTFANTPDGFHLFQKAYNKQLPTALVILETTGGYERELVRYLQQQSTAVHRANTRQVKHYRRSLGVLGKSDAIDAKALAHYGADRHARLKLFVEDPHQKLQQYVQRRQDLKQMLVQEKNRLQSPDQKALKSSFDIIIKALQQELAAIDQAIEQYCQSHPHLKAVRKTLETVEGIGKVVSVQLLALLPEIGKLNRKQVASLAGVAPHPYESGKKLGYRMTRGGRKNVKAVLFMAALTASRSKSRLGNFYQGLVARGKKSMVVLVALMRKILVIANARVKEYFLQAASQQG